MACRTTICKIHSSAFDPNKINCEGAAKYRIGVTFQRPRLLSAYSEESFMHNPGTTLIIQHEDSNQSHRERADSKPQQSNMRWRSSAYTHPSRWRSKLRPQALIHDEVDRERNSGMYTNWRRNKQQKHKLNTKKQIRSTFGAQFRVHYRHTHLSKSTFPGKWTVRKG